MTYNRTVEEALDEMTANVELPYEALPTIALAYRTARMLDQWSASNVEGYSPLANTMLKQITALREWIAPPAVIEDDPFDALARALSGSIGDDEH